jgi:NADH:ubiquinone reductase (H+-translocating)
MKRVLVLGGGFAGLWAAVAAQRKLREIGREREATVTLVNRTAYHNIRVRNYEADLSDVCVALDEVLAPVGVDRVFGDVVGLDASSRTVGVRMGEDVHTLVYDGLVFALGSQLVSPALPGFSDFAFNVDTYAAAASLRDHLATLPSIGAPGAATIVVIGAGLTGLEVATEMPARLGALFPSAKPGVILVDHNTYVGSDMGEHARPFIIDALQQAGVKLRLAAAVAEIQRDAVLLSSGESIPAYTAIWCAGMRANPLCADIPVEHDKLGRIRVDKYLRVNGQDGMFAAGDAAAAKVDADHLSVMSCQHARPMGRFAGHNVVAELFDLPMLPLSVDWYVTVLDLGNWGAVYTKGFDRQVVSTGAAAKDTKRTINRRRIYPPRSRDPEEILAAAAAIVQRPPATVRPAED